MFKNLCQMADQVLILVCHCRMEKEHVMIRSESRVMKLDQIHALEQKTPAKAVAEPDIDIRHFTAQTCSKFQSNISISWTGS